MKRFFAAIMTVVMLLSAIPFAAFAAAPATPAQSSLVAGKERSIPPTGLSTQRYAAALAQQNTQTVQQTVSGGQNLTMEATNSLSALMLAGMDEDPDAENSGSDAEHYRITNIGITGQTAQVNLVAGGPADLVVGIYSTDGKQLLASGTQRLDQVDGNGTASVALTGTLPDYFVVKGYLLDVDERFALSDVYVNTLFTEEMANLADATTEDFDPDLVINLDEQQNTNFGVVKADVTLLDDDPVTEDENIITQDGDSYVYTIENPTEEFTNLQEGETFVYHGPDGLLVAKVKDIREEGGKLVITGDDQLDIRDVFDVLKIDSDQESSEFHYVEGSIDGEVTVEEPHDVDFSPQAPEYTGDTADNAAVDEDNNFVEDLAEQIQELFEPKKDTKTIQKAISVHAEKEYKQKYTDDLEYSVKVKIDSDIAVSANFAYYIAFDRVYVATTAELEMKGVYGIDAQLKANLDLGDYSATDTMTGVSIGLTASIDIDVTANATVTLLTTAIIGGSYQLGYGFKNLSQNPYYQMTADAEVVVKAAVHINPFVGASYGLVRLYLNLDFVATLTAHANFRQVDSEFTLDSRDGCSPVCFAFNLHITCSGSLQIKLRLLKEKDDIAFDPLKLWDNAVLLDGDAYWSPSRQEFAFTKCPHTEYRVTATLDGVNNTTALPLYLQQDGNTPELFGECTYVNPTKFYLEGGTYRIYSVVDGFVFASDEFTLDKAMDITLTKHPEIDLDELLNSGRADDGKDGNYITYTFNEKTGTLIISGTGAMPSFDTANGGIARPWDMSKVKKIIIREGVTEIGNDAFAYSSALKEIYLPESLKNVVNYAFAYFDPDNVKVYYAGTIKQWRKVSVGLSSDTREYTNVGFVKAVKHCTDGDTNLPMAGGSGTQKDPYQIATPEQLDAIHDWPTASYYVLVDDIDLSGIEWEPYNGYINFDGQGHTVSNLTITNTSASNPYNDVNIGMFGMVESYWSNYYAGTFRSQIRNLNLEDVNISVAAVGGDQTTLNVGAIVGKCDWFNDGADIQNCTASGKIDVQGGYGAWIGGFAGRGTQNCVIKISNCTNNLEITYTRGQDTYQYAVGPYQGIWCEVSDCINNGKIIVDGVEQTTT